MATWKDGAAYAPLERPDGFATPVADPLPTAPPYRADTPGPMDHPQGFAPLEQPPLRQLGTKPNDARDPQTEFNVARLAMTSGPESVPSRDPKRAFALSNGAAVTSDPPPPTGAPLAVPPPMPGYVGQYGGQWAPPGQVGWSAAPAQDVRSSRTLCWVAAVLAGCGLIFSPGAPFLLIIAGALGIRTRAISKSLGPIALSVGVLGLALQLFTGTLGNYNALLALLSMAVSIGFIVFAAQAKA